MYVDVIVLLSPADLRLRDLPGPYIKILTEVCMQINCGGLRALYSKIEKIEKIFEPSGEHFTLPGHSVHDINWLRNI